jgi:RND superfamily putative drug exporter
LLVVVLAVVLFGAALSLPSEPRLDASLDVQRALAGSLSGDLEVDPETVHAPAEFVDRAGVPAPATRAAAVKANLVDGEGRVAQVRAAARSDTGTEAAADLVERIRDEYIPQSGFDPGRVFVTGAAAFSVAFIDTAYTAFPWLAAGVLLLSYLLLMRAFRSLSLPLKAVLMNLLSVSATYGVLVLAFQKGWGEPFRLQQSLQIEAWNPIFLFAMLFGLSMDYEVFLLSRMREE